MNARTVNSLLVGRQGLYPVYPHKGLKDGELALFPVLAAICIHFLGAKKKDFKASSGDHKAHRRHLEAALAVISKLDAPDESEALKAVADNHKISVKKLLKKLSKAAPAKSAGGFSC